ncbi:MAG: hypothetical protein Pyrs2KO_30480 [Pyruvatibacter sp.]
MQSEPPVSLLPYQAEGGFYQLGCYGPPAVARQYSEPFEFREAGEIADADGTNWA